MILSGLAATPHAALQNHVLVCGAIDVAQRCPLFIEHKHAVGEVTLLHYIGHDLHIACETDDADALKLNFFSVAGRPVERRQRADGVWIVSKFCLFEISLVRVPANDRCRVYQRKTSSPFLALSRTRARELDLFKQAFGCAGRMLELLPRIQQELKQV